MTKNLFKGLIEFDNDKEFNSFIEKINTENSILILETAIKSGVLEGYYTLEETYALYKSLSKLKENEDKHNNILPIDNNSNPD